MQATPLTSRHDATHHVTSPKEMMMSRSDPRRPRVAFLRVFVLGTLAVSGTAVGRDTPGMGIAQPTTYRSASGAYSLHVDPHDRMGKTSADYRFLKNDKELWSGERKYTLREVTVTDKGLVVGIAYRNVPVETENDRRGAEGFFHAIVLDQSGAEVLNDETRRRRSMHTTPPTPDVPFAKQIIVDTSNDRLFIRAMEFDCDSPYRRSPVWMLWTLSTGKTLARFNPQEKMASSDNMQWVLDAQLVTATPLIAVHWYTKGPDWEVKDAGARFLLVDSEGHTVWSLSAESDYAEIDFGWAPGGGISKFFREHPAILPVKKGAHFGIRLLAPNEQVTFAVDRRGPDEWSVSEVGRKAYEEMQVATGPATDQTKGKLKYLGELDLGAGHRQPSPFRTVFDFTFNKSGDVHFWRRTDEGEATLVHVNHKTGDVIDERAFPQIESRFGLHWTDTARLKDNRFLVMRKVLRDSNENPAWLVDLVTGEEEPFAAYPGGRSEGIGRFSNGEFVTVGSTLACYGAAGKLKWEIDREHPDWFPVMGKYPRDVVVTADRRIAVLTMGSIELLDHEGKYLKSISLIGAFGTDEFRGMPGYLREIVADSHGGFLIKNSRTPPVVLRYNADGSVRSRWSPRHPDGRTFDIRPGVRVAPNGRLWTSDGQSIMRLTEDGVVDLLLGEPPDTNLLDKLAGMTVAGNGWIYAVARGTGAIHVFNERGQFERLDAPDPTDFAGTVKKARIVVTENGDYFVERPPNTPTDEYLHFSSTGERIGFVTFERGVGRGWQFQPGTGYRCGFSWHHTLTIVDTSGRVVREVKKRLNGMWFDYVYRLAVAPDGAMAVLYGERGDDNGPGELDLFSANGDPIRTIPLPKARKRFSGIAYCGQRVVIAGNEEVLIVNTTDGSVERWALVEPGVTDPGWRAYIRAGGRELLLHELKFSYEVPTIHRYQLP